MLGDKLTAIFTDEDDELLLSVNDTEEAEDRIILRLDADIYEFDNELFESLKNAVSSVENAEITVCFDSASETGNRFTNEMIDRDNCEVLIFKARQTISETKK